MSILGLWDPKGGVKGFSNLLTKHTEAISAASTTIVKEHLLQLGERMQIIQITYSPQPDASLCTRLLR